MQIIKPLLLLTTLLIPIKSFGINLGEKYLHECSFNFTQEQLSILDKANVVGEESNLSLPLQAIIMSESFVWKSVIRTREVGNTDVSFGIGHIRPTTASWLAKRTSLYNITPSEVKAFLSHAGGDTMALFFTLKYLKFLQQRSDTLTEVFGRYNAGKYWEHSRGKKYSKKVWNNVKYLEKCLDYNLEEVVYD